MNIKSRINARKVVLIFFYQIYFTHYYSGLEKHYEDALNVEKELGIDVGKAGKDKFVEQFKNYYDLDNYEEEVDYLINNFFKKEKREGIDIDYVFKVVPNYSKYLKKIEKIVDKESVSFKFEEMDLMDRVIFILGYTENKVLKTPKKVILNEMIELAKRFGDQGSPKLINGIGHKLIDEDKK